MGSDPNPIPRRYEATKGSFNSPARATAAAAAPCCSSVGGGPAGGGVSSATPPVCEISCRIPAAACCLKSVKDWGTDVVTKSVGEATATTVPTPPTSDAAAAGSHASDPSGAAVDSAAPGAEADWAADDAAGAAEGEDVVADAAEVSVITGSAGGHCQVSVSAVGAAATGDAESAAGAAPGRCESVMCPLGRILNQGTPSFFLYKTTAPLHLQLPVETIRLPQPFPIAHSSSCSPLRRRVGPPPQGKERQTLASPYNEGDRAKKQRLCCLSFSFAAPAAPKKKE